MSCPTDDSVRWVPALKPWVFERAEGCSYLSGSDSRTMKRCGHPIVVATIGKNAGRMHLCALHAHMLGLKVSK